MSLDSILIIDLVLTSTCPQIQILQIETMKDFFKVLILIIEERIQLLDVFYGGSDLLAPTDGKYRKEFLKLTPVHQKSSPRLARKSELTDIF